MAIDVRSLRLARLRARALGLSLATLLLAGTVGGTLAARLQTDESPALGHAQVIAHGVVAFTEEDELAWRVAGREATPPRPGPSGEPDPIPTGFLVGQQGSLLVTDTESDELTLVAPGEAILTRAGDQLTLEAPDGDLAAYYAIELIEGGGPGDDLAFPSPGGRRDVDLVRDVLAPGEAGELPDSGQPTLVLATVGEIEIEEGESDPVLLRSGEAALFEGELFVSGASTDDATYVAVVIGPAIDGVGEDGPSGAPGGTGTGGGGNETGSGGNETGSGGAEPAPTPTPADADDPDDDGLTNEDEAIRDTDPNDPDSDDDGLNDGVEVYESGTLPLDLDSDDDGLSDGDEVNQFGTNPSNADSDDDGLLDGDELLVHGTNPTNPDSDVDGLPDGDEVNVYGSNPLNYDGDGDFLPDFDEVMSHGTDPSNPDSDGDAALDGDEVNAGTDPNDPTSTP